MRILKALMLLLLMLASCWLLVLWLDRYTALPPALPEDSQSSQRLKSGPYAVGRDDVLLPDNSRPTAAHGKQPEQTARTLNTAVWFPLAADGQSVAEGLHPLVVHSHGFSSNRQEPAYLARHLASHGYIVMAPDFPLTNMGAAGGPLLDDVVNQPGDVRFLITSALKWNRAEGHPFHQRIDADRIAAMGVSLGGLTTTLATFHPRLRDPRIAAAISIAGPSTMFDRAFFAQSRTPFLMIAGDIDAILPYEDNAAPLPTKHPQALLVSLRGGSHTGFADTSRWLRWFSNPDSLGCWVVQKRKSADSGSTIYPALLDGSRGIIEDRRDTLCKTLPLPPAMNALRQQQLTTLAVRAFFDSRFAPTPEARAQALQFLTTTLPAEQDDLYLGRHD